RSNWTYNLEIGTGGEIIRNNEQAIGSISDNHTWDIGQAAFSPDGHTWANSTEAYGIMLFDFDPTTGELSNYREVHYPNMDTAEGMAFSPSGEYIYVTTAEHLYQIDWMNSDTSSRVYEVARVRFPDAAGWPVGLGFINAGPDCRLYVAPGSSTNVFHVIHSPDEYGAACDFVAGAVVAPTVLEFDFPNLPNYAPLRPCDPDIAWGLPVATEEEPAAPVREARLSPNPTPGQTLLSWSAESRYTELQVWSLDGRLLQAQALVASQTQFELDLAEMPVGTYLVKLIGESDTQTLRTIKQ
ncbi:MAG: T9SS C-terminal target domain-containing protein, partial [Bacteroidetes bacterium]